MILKRITILKGQLKLCATGTPVTNDLQYDAVKKESGRLNTISDLQALGIHITPASSVWSQLLVPHGLCAHAPRPNSEPVHFTSSSQIVPLPPPK